MARNVILEADYHFDPVAKTVHIDQRWIRPERLMLITNVTKNIVIYNFSDPALGFTNWERLGNELAGIAQDDDVSPNMIGTQVTLKYNTAAMDATDLLQIYVDDASQSVTFDETLLDGAQKLRVSQPQSLIDTDFEYSIQPSKWESLFLTQNYPGFFAKPGGGNSLLVNSIVGDNSVPKSIMTVTTASPHGLTSGSIISVQETMNYRAEGTFAVLDAPSATTVRYFARGQVSGEVNYSNLSAVYAGDVYDGAHIPGGAYPGQGNVTNWSGVLPANTMKSWTATSDNAYPYSTITVTFDNAHGLFPGTPISISGTSTIDGDWYVVKVPTVKTLQFQITKQVPFTVTIPTTGRIIPKAEGYVIHRPYDAGVALAAVLPNPGIQTIRQTRKYFRYQAGKAMQFSTGAKFTPTYSIDSLSLNSGTIGSRTVSVQTVEDHGLQIGAEVLVEGVKIQSINGQNPYNGVFTVSAVNDSNSFSYTVNITQTIPTHDLKAASPDMFAHAYRWYGAATRTGMFDDQNGFWFEYDGQETYVCRRHSERLLQGRLNVTKDSNQVVGTGTLFREQLISNDMIVIKGTSYKVLHVNSDTSLTISPAYRGPSTNGVRATHTIIFRVAQDEWNMDKCDGTGPSGYVLDITKMQMVYIDYSWYGAGTIRFGLRGPQGKVFYVHRMPQNNINALAYQKSGNLPARYEVSTEPIQNTRMIAGASGTRGSVLSPTGTTLFVENVHDWPPIGYIWVKDAVNCEIMKYTSIGTYDATVEGYPLNVLRRQSITYAYPDKTYSFSGTTDQVAFAADSSFTGSGADAQVAVQTIGITCAPIIQHWGSSVIEDGQFNNDLLPVFTGGMTKYLSVNSGTARPLIALRLAPSVDNALGRNYGLRELNNRMQLALKSIGVQTNGAFRIDVLMNPDKIYYRNHTAAELAITKTSTNITMANGTKTMAVAAADTDGTTGIALGMGVSGTNVPANTIVAGVNGSTILLNNATTGTSSGNYTFTPALGYTGLPDDWSKDSAGLNSLAQVLYFDNAGPGAGLVPTTYAPTGYLNGGDSVFSFFTENGGGATNFNASSFDLSGIRELGNSILNGNGNISTPGYPQGPDVLVIQATNIGATVSKIATRISWIEAQA